MTELDCMNWVISLKEFDLLWHFDVHNSVADTKSRFEEANRVRY